MQDILETLSLSIKNITSVSGGDINETFCIETTIGKKYFLKVNDANKFPEMFAKEANGLNALRDGSNLIVPQIISQGVAGSKQYLLLEWLEKGIFNDNFWKNFGHSLAQMHKLPQAYFGFEEDNFIGSLSQKNTISKKWSEFYATCRILPLVKKLKDDGVFSKNEMSYGENFCKKIDEILPAEPASLLHGDLWSGNYMIAKNGAAAIFDPAVYFGHREMDIGMTKLFGGFSQPFYEAYNEMYPLEKDWQQRIPYTQLYPLLVHAILFGGHYIESAREILREF